MEGANEYYELFNGTSQQIGRLFLQLHTHARGPCFEIFLLPDGIEVTGSDIGGIKDVVEVYGMTGGQRGWTETYGWLHSGKWQDDFDDIVKRKKTEREVIRLKIKEEMTAKKTQENKKMDSLLATYP